MSLLKLRTFSPILNVGRQSAIKYPKLLRNENILPLLSTSANNCLFHSFAINRNDSVSNHTTRSPSIIKRNYTVGENEPFPVTVMRFFMESPYVQDVENFILQFHDFSGLHWWSAIVVMTFGARFVFTSPLYAYQQYIFAKVELVEKQMDKIVAQLKKHANSNVVRLGINPKQAQGYYNSQVRKEWNKLIVKNNCHPMKGSIVILFQLPLWLYISAALRNILSAYPPDNPAILMAATEMTVGGPFWCSNLLLPDPTYILPISLTLINLAIMEVQVLRRWNGKESLIRKIGINAFRLIALLTGPIAAQMPAAISLYWVSSSSFGLAQNLAVFSPKIRRICGIPYTPSEQERPYQHLVEKFKERSAARRNKSSTFS